MSRDLVASGPGWTLHRGDCLAGALGARGLGQLDDRSVDVVITDPPYEVESHSKGRRTKTKNWKQAVERGEDDRVAMAEPLPFAAITEFQRTVTALHLARVAKRWILVFCQVEAATAWRAALELGGARYVRTSIWSKPDGQPQFTGDRPGMGYESIVVAHAPGVPLRWNGGGRLGVFEYSKGCYPEGVNGQAKKPHPTTKPLPLMLDLVELFSDAGEIVLDPFAGSASTGVACLQRGREFLGWELDPVYHERGCRRLNGDEAIPSPDQPSLLDFMRVASAPQHGGAAT